MAQVNVRGLDQDAYDALKAIADAEGIPVAEVARRALVTYPAAAGPGTARVAAEVDQQMIRSGIPKWSRDKVLAIITGSATATGVPHIMAQHYPAHIKPGSTDAATA